MRLIFPTMPYGLCSEKRGWKCTETTQLTPKFLGIGAVRYRWNFGFIKENKE